MNKKFLSLIIVSFILITLATAVKELTNKDKDKLEKYFEKELKKELKDKVKVKDYSSKYSIGDIIALDVDIEETNMTVFMSNSIFEGVMED